MTAGDDDAIGLRERKKRETRLALSHATIRLCVERGWNNFTVEDIAAEANVSVRTFRNYFASKAEAIAAKHLERMLRIAEQLRARPATEPLWDSIYHAVQAQFTSGDETAQPSPGGERWMAATRLMLAEPALHGEILKANAVAQDELAEAIAERTGTDVAHDLYPQLVAAVVGAANSVAVAHWMRGDSPGSVVPLLREAFDQIEAGLPVP
ncbi:acyl-CoA-like ligand-binding transcription factor [Saccharopolyspora sp. 5N708]|uniref:acyl-CoA-like ligand-binding transcription factor n=1 Tax=Saccharopolyspora sp. 5N708 TaxID=3457424 RepID=UPI003FD16113